MDIEPEAAQGFSKGAGAYERGRPGYPAAAVDWIVERLRLSPGRTVVDLAAGTGKFTRQLVPAGAALVAVEPVAEMRAILREQAPMTDVREGTAEAIPLADGAADALTAAQAFHWFDAARALPEIHRVLRPGGQLALVWNSRDEGDPLQATISRLRQPHRGDAPTHESGAWKRVFKDTTLFTPFDRRGFPHEQRLSRDGVVDRVLSTSVIAALDDARREQVEAQIRAAIEQHTEPVTLRYITDVYICTRR